MSDRSAIEWTDATWPVVTGCDYASPGCANCYAVRDARRLSHNPNEKVARAYEGVVMRPSPAGKLRWTGRVNCLEERLAWPLRWRKPRKVFVCNESDLFHPDVPDVFIDRVFAVMALTPQHTYQVLTKRAERMRAYMAGNVRNRVLNWFDGMKPLRERRADPRWPLPNAWLGVSVENQHFADERIPLLLQTSAAVRFISAEPLLEKVDLTSYLWTIPGARLNALHWIIVGGESGHGARPFDVAWARWLVAQGQSAGVPVFVKQLGANAQDADGSMHGRYSAGGIKHDFPKLLNRKGGDPNEWPPDLRVRQFPEARA